MVLFRVVTSALLPVAIASLFCLIGQKGKCKSLPYMTRRIIIGVTFGIVAVLATLFDFICCGSNLLCLQCDVANIGKKNNMLNRDILTDKTKQGEVLL